jgi:hypothetical protein
MPNTKKVTHISHHHGVGGDLSAPQSFFLEIDNATAVQGPPVVVTAKGKLNMIMGAAPALDAWLTWWDDAKDPAKDAPERTPPNSAFSFTPIVMPPPHFDHTWTITFGSSTVRLPYNRRYILTVQGVYRSGGGLASNWLRQTRFVDVGTPPGGRITIENLTVGINAPPAPDSTWAGPYNASGTFTPGDASAYPWILNSDSVKIFPTNWNSVQGTGGNPGTWTGSFNPLSSGAYFLMAKVTKTGETPATSSVHFYV